MTSHGAFCDECGVRARFGKLLLAVTLITAIGGHWALLQSVAWVGMFANNARQGSLTEALEKTFDGNHPCGLCKVVAAGKKAEQKETIVKVEAKLDFWLEPVSALLDAPPPAGQPVIRAETFSPRVESPPTPPPRA